jgi:hypothetical protein
MAAPSSNPITSEAESFCSLMENTIFLDFVPDIDPTIEKISNISTFDCCIYMILLYYCLYNYEINSNLNFR